jgi:hypothetical protein
MKLWTRPFLLAALLAVTGALTAAEIDVMQQNQYLGTDLTPVITAPPELLNDRLVGALETVAASLPAQRIDRLAKQIAARMPHAVVLNEAFAYSCANLFPDTTPATEGCGNQRISGAFLDFLEATETNLDDGYVVKARVRNFAIAGLPFEIDGYYALLTVEDRDAILVRSDVAPMAQAVPLAMAGCRASLEGCNYVAVPTILTALGPVTIERGYTAVDLVVEGDIYRVFGTHLEVRQLVPGPAGEPTRVLQRLQAAELAQTALYFPTAPGTRVLVVGDINSAPTDGFDVLATPIGPLPPPYAIFLGAGFTDAWTLRPGVGPGTGAPLVGHSCCQDEDLANQKSVLYERIDIIFSLEMPENVGNARLLGESIADKTWPPGLGVWPSDHASVAVTLKY